MGLELSTPTTFLPTSGPLSAKDYKSRLQSSEGTQSLFFPQSGYSIRFAYVTQRGYYPDAPEKANQDALCIHPQFGGDMEQAFFGIFDGHGEYGTQCAQFAKEKVCNFPILASMRNTPCETLHDHIACMHHIMLLLWQLVFPGRFRKIC